MQVTFFRGAVEHNHMVVRLLGWVSEVPGSTS